MNIESNQKNEAYEKKGNLFPIVLFFGSVIGLVSLSARIKKKSEFKHVVKKLSTRRKFHDSKQEQLFNFVLNSNNLEFSLEDIAHIFIGGDTEAVRLAEKKLSEINNTKLRALGYQIRPLEKRWGVFKIDE